MKKTLAIMMTAVLSMSVLFGCSGKAATETKAAETTAATEAETTEGGTLKTGLSVITSLSGENASEEKEGVAQTDVAVVAVTVTEDGVIESCEIDAVQAKIQFTTAGELTNADAEFLSKNELGEEYGMKKFSEIGKEWNEQAEAMATYAEGKTLDEIKNGAIDESGYAKDEDLASSATINLYGFINGIEEAVNNATDMGASVGDELKLVTVTNAKKSSSATAEEDGTAQAYTHVAAITMNGETITSCYIEAVQANITFNAKGEITSDLGAEVLTKNQIGADYGMASVSSIGKEWNEQTAAFCEYVTGKTVAEVTGIAVNENGAPADEDLASSVTIGIGNFTALIEKAAQ